MARVTLNAIASMLEAIGSRLDAAEKRTSEIVDRMNRPQEARPRIETKRAPRQIVKVAPTAAERAAKTADAVPVVPATAMQAAGIAAGIVTQPSLASVTPEPNAHVGIVRYLIGKYGFTRDDGAQSVHAFRAFLRPDPSGKINEKTGKSSLTRLGEVSVFTADGTVTSVAANLVSCFAVKAGVPVVFGQWARKEATGKVRQGRTIDCPALAEAFAVLAAQGELSETRNGYIVLGAKGDATSSGRATLSADAI